MSIAPALRLLNGVPYLDRLHELLSETVLSGPFLLFIPHTDAQNNASRKKAIYLSSDRDRGYNMIGLR